MSTRDSRAQYRRLEIDVGSDERKWVDITHLLGDEELVVEDNVSELDSMTFTLSRGGDSALQVLVEGMRVRFKGGYLEGRKEWLFEGFVTSADIQYKDDGDIAVEVTAVNILWPTTLFKPGFVTYPTIRTENCPYQREFHFVDEIKLSEIVRGILEEYDVEIGELDIKPAYDFTFTQLHPISQNEDESDYAFLRRLLTGETTGGGYTDNGEDEPEMHGHALLLVQTSGTGDQPETSVQIRSDQYLIEEDSPSDIVFVFHRRNSNVLLADFALYEVDGLATRLSIHGVRPQHNTGEAKQPHTMRVKETPRSAISKLFDRKKHGKGGALAPVDKAAEVEHAPDGPAGPQKDPPGGWNAWEFDEAAFAAAEEAGEFGSGFDNLNPAEVVANWPWEKAKRFFKPRETRYEASNIQLTADTHDDALKVDEDKPQDLAAGGGPSTAGGRKSKSGDGVRRAKTIRKNPATPKQWGDTLTFQTHFGNPAVFSRKLHRVEGLLPKHEGLWFLLKVRHKFGAGYTLEIEGAR